jgi:hypothetical protein
MFPDAAPCWNRSCSTSGKADAHAPCFHRLSGPSRQRASRLLAANARLLGAVVKLFARVVYIERARAAGIESARTGVLSFQRCFGGSLNAHRHVHDVWVDGVFALDRNSAQPRFHFTAPPTSEDIQRLAAVVGVRINRMLRRAACLATRRTIPTRRRRSTTPSTFLAAWATAAAVSSGSTRADARSRSCFRTPACV